MNKYNIIKDKNGMRWVNIQGRGAIPLDLAALGAGADAWLRDCKCSCAECGEQTTVSASDIPGMCPDCVEAEYEENMRADGHI